MRFLVGRRGDLLGMTDCIYTFSNLLRFLYRNVTDMPSHSISIFGLGYVGSVMAACLAHEGHRVIGVDVSASKVTAINEGRSPIIEARMDELVRDGVAAGRLGATTDAGLAVGSTELSFVCVGTPSGRDGKVDLSHVAQVSQSIGRAIGCVAGRRTVIVRSTIIPGATETVVIPTLEAASGKRAGEDFNVVYNPEFMREGSAVADFFDPALTVLGADSPAALDTVREIYGGAGGRIIETSIRAAEMVKYASNAFHAVKVAFANEVGSLAKQLGADAEAVASIFASDFRLNVSPAYLRPGFAFGGSCLPKDVRALAYCARERGMRLPLLDSLLASNNEHIQRAAEMVIRGGAKKVALLGLSFKAGTDDVRESPQVKLARLLLGEGCSIAVWDPHVTLDGLTGANRQYLEAAIPNIGLMLSADVEDVIENAEVVIIASPAADEALILRHLQPGQNVIDLVNLEKIRRPAPPGSYEGICW